MRLTTLSLLFANTFLSLGAISKESCPDIPGWMFLGDSNPKKHAEVQRMSMDEIEKNGRDMTISTCCDYKNKCKFDLFEFRKGKPGWELCTFDASCNGVMDESLEITTKYGNGGFQIRPYCQNVFEEGRIIPMSYCSKASECFQKSRGKDDLLTCMDAAFGTILKYRGFMSNIAFPYTKFSFTQRNFVTDDIIYKMNAGGNIVKDTKPPPTF